MNTVSLLLCIALAVCILWGICRLLRSKLTSIGRGFVLAVGILSVFVSLSVAAWAQPKVQVTVTALNRKNEAAQSVELNLSHLQVGGGKSDVPDPISGEWTRLKGEYRWFAPGDARRAAAQSDDVTFAFPVLDRTELVFAGNAWKGLVEVTVDGESQILDTYREKDEQVTFALPTPSTAQTAQALGISVAAFVLSMLALCGVGVLLGLLGQWLASKHPIKPERGSLLQKLAGYQFLFEELVKRDFMKKYKRTVLGMAWSILSPLLTLFVMRLVFTQFFGRGMAHYTTYLFCGNLIFTYFNESTSQGMTSLVGNAAIFTKVNVPKYLFLFSKNVQTLINFGLTLCVFFAFCILDGVTFTWRFVCLVYPILCLVLFNIGVGLVLSALFVFFKDIQYLWSVFTMLLMYMSAIFYTIDNYPPLVQNAFLANPVYLFIRYFRKIVLDATIPSIWFHLLILADVAIVLGAGCWMYKKYNTKFLYYV